MEIGFEYRDVLIQRFDQNTWDNFRNNLQVILKRDEAYFLVRQDQTQKPVIQAAPASKIHAAAPAFAVAGQTLDIRFSILDAYNNPAFPSPVGNFQVAEVRDPFECIGSTALEPKDGGSGTIPVQAPNEPGRYRFIISDTKDSLQGRTQIVQVGSVREDGIFFGDIHAKTGLSDGLGTPDQYYRHLRDHACMDFGAISDHHDTPAINRTEGPFKRVMTDEEFGSIRDAGEKFNQPGRFITLQGFEQTYLSDFPGHRNVYFRGGMPEMFRGITIKDFMEYLEGKEALVIPHHTLYGNRLKPDFPYIDRFRVIEMYSMHLSSEKRGSPYNDGKPEIGYSAQEVLAQGHRVGFIAASDNHNGKPGLSAKPSRFVNLVFSGGLAAVYAPELTREAVYDALYRRCCYATTGERIILDFKVNGSRMGSEIHIKAGEKVELEVFCGGTGEIACIEILKDNQVVKVFQDGFSSMLEVRMEEMLTRSCQYYIRVTQTDRHMAWSSPVWVDIE
ncbi:MAG TPA: hypothetical protein DD727_06110 [Clostridiales bacterium]|nr:hypothetical protein [Clostridiales bacterium]